MAFKLLFVKDFDKDITTELKKAKKRVYVQFMTFEGDKTGLSFARKLIAAHKKNNLDTRVLIDRFTDRFVSKTYYRNKEVAEEVEATRHMFSEMQEAGIRMNRTRPYGFLRLLFMIRNHKKIIIIDDICYLGGVNLSDHNYEWYDFMVKITDPRITKAVVGDFKHSWKGEDRPYHDHTIYTDKYLEYKYRDLIREAKKEIIVSSPYVLDMALIKDFKHKPVKRIVLTSHDGNIGIINYLAKYITAKLSDMGVDIYHYKRFSHAKFLLVDREKLLIGSSNFGQENFSALDEIGIVIEDKKFINEFLKQVHPDHTKHHTRFTPKKGVYFWSWLATVIAHYGLKLYVKFFKKWSQPLG